MEIIDEESSPNSMFVYAIRSKLTRDYYLTRLRKLFDFLHIESLETIEGRCNIFAELAKSNNNWVVNGIIRFLQIQKERVEAGQITGATLPIMLKP